MLAPFTTLRPPKLFSTAKVERKASRVARLAGGCARAGGRIGCSSRGRSRLGTPLTWALILALTLALILALSGGSGRRSGCVLLAAGPGGWGRGAAGLPTAGKSSGGKRGGERCPRPKAARRND